MDPLDFTPEFVERLGERFEACFEVLMELYRMHQVADLGAYTEEEQQAVIDAVGAAYYLADCLIEVLGTANSAAEERFERLSSRARQATEGPPRPH